jgi:hypothetical protein
VRRDVLEKPIEKDLHLRITDTYVDGHSGSGASARARKGGQAKLDVVWTFHIKPVSGEPRVERRHRGSSLIHQHVLSQSIGKPTSV